MNEFITTRKEFLDFCEGARVRPDWHEPDEQGFTCVELRSGEHLDNACISSSHEAHLVLVNEETQTETKINVAILLAWARGYEGIA